MRSAQDIQRKDHLKTNESLLGWYSHVIPHLGGGGKRIRGLGTSPAVSYLVHSEATGDPVSKKSNQNHRRGAHLIPLQFPVSVPHLLVHSIHSC